MQPLSDVMTVRPSASETAAPDAERQQRAFAAERRAVEIALAEIMAERHPGTVWTPLGDEEPAPGAVVVRIGDVGTSKDEASPTLKFGELPHLRPSDVERMDAWYLGELGRRFGGRFVLQDDGDTGDQ